MILNLYQVGYLRNKCCDDKFLRVDVSLLICMYSGINEIPTFIPLNKIFQLNFNNISLLVNWKLDINYNGKMPMVTMKSWNKISLTALNNDKISLKKNFICF